MYIPVVFGLKKKVVKPIAIIEVKNIWLKNFSMDLESMNIKLQAYPSNKGMITLINGIFEKRLKPEVINVDKSTASKLGLWLWIKAVINV